MNIKTVGKWIVAIWIIAILGSLTVTAGLIYVAIHFISKFW